MLRRLRKTFMLVATIVLLVVAALLMAVGLGRITGEYQFVPVLSGSMTPTFQAGDAVIVRPIEPQAVRKGQVLAFHPPAMAGSQFKPTDTVVHRVIGVRNENGVVSVRTWGDANGAPDQWQAELKPGKVSVVVGYAPKLGYALLWLHQPLVRGALVGVLAFLLIAMVTQGFLERGDAPSGGRGRGDQSWVLTAAAPPRAG